MWRQAVKPRNLARNCGRLALRILNSFDKLLLIYNSCMILTQGRLK